MGKYNLYHQPPGWRYFIVKISFSLLVSLLNKIILAIKKRLITAN